RDAPPPGGGERGGGGGRGADGGGDGPAGGAAERPAPGRAGHVQGPGGPRGDLQQPRLRQALPQGGGGPGGAVLHAVLGPHAAGGRASGGPSRGVPGGGPTWAARCWAWRGSARPSCWAAARRSWPSTPGLESGRPRGEAAGAGHGVAGPDDHGGALPGRGRGRGHRGAFLGPGAGRPRPPGPAPPPTRCCCCCCRGPRAGRLTTQRPGQGRGGSRVAASPQA
ncbi:unnamed protein product, partial [Heterosigma akashiwo]